MSLRSEEEEDIAPVEGFSLRNVFGGARISSAISAQARPISLNVPSLSQLAPQPMSGACSVDAHWAPLHAQNEMIHARPPSATAAMADHQMANAMNATINANGNFAPAPPKKSSFGFGPAALRKVEQALGSQPSQPLQPSQTPQPSQTQQPSQMRIAPSRAASRSAHEPSSGVIASIPAPIASPLNDNAVSTESAPGKGDEEWRLRIREMSRHAELASSRAREADSRYAAQVNALAESKRTVAALTERMKEADLRVKKANEATMMSEATRVDVCKANESLLAELDISSRKLGDAQEMETQCAELRLQVGELSSAVDATKLAHSSALEDVTSARKLIDEMQMRIDTCVREIEQCRAEERALVLAELADSKEASRHCNDDIAGDIAGDVAVGAPQTTIPHDMCRSDSSTISLVSAGACAANAVIGSQIRVHVDALGGWHGSDERHHVVDATDVHLHDVGATQQLPKPNPMVGAIVADLKQRIELKMKLRKPVVSI